MYTRKTRSRVWVATLAAGGSLFVLEGCDPGVRESVLGGVAGAATGLATTFIEAFFQGLINDGQEEVPAVVNAAYEFTPEIFS